MPKIKVKVSTNKVGSESEKEFEVSEEDLKDEAFIEDLVNERVNNMIYVTWEVVE